jgi:tetratricopeptide (TPR) repeat protein
MRFGWKSDEVPLKGLYFNLGTIYFRQGQFDKAVQEFQRGIDLNSPALEGTSAEEWQHEMVSETAQLHVAKAEALLKLNRKQEAIAEYRQAATMGGPAKQKAEKELADLGQ